MKKLLLFIPVIAVTTSAMGQSAFVLNGSSYTQNFNNIGTTLPTGWAGDTAASLTKAGVSVPYDGSKIKWQDVRGAFKNFASANGLTMGSDSAAQASSADRAFGLRQVSNTASSLINTDPGGAFVFRIAQTNGLTAFKLKFRLQSLDTSSPRQTTWQVDYGFGNNPTSFTKASAISPNTLLVTGGNKFSNDSVTVDFGAALNNQTGNVWIRISTVTASSGSGNRPSTAIDDFNLTWTGTANSVSEISKQLSEVGLYPNPNNGNFTVKGKLNANNATVEVINLIGKVVMQKNVSIRNGELNSNISMDNSAKGMYFLRVTADNESKTTRFTVL